MRIVGRHIQEGVKMNLQKHVLLAKLEDINHRTLFAESKNQLDL